MLVDFFFGTAVILTVPTYKASQRESVYFLRDAFFIILQDD